MRCAATAHMLRRLVWEATHTHIQEIGVDGCGTPWDQVFQPSPLLTINHRAPDAACVAPQKQKTWVQSPQLLSQPGASNRAERTPLL